ncbi:MAG TPA: VOC family protein [Stellaceae bacterium]|nr:VOC family protein [Stellaceae bacterium]
MSEASNGTYDVGGIRMARPFRPLRLGHFGWNYLDSKAALHFYADLLGLIVSDEENFAHVLQVEGDDIGDPNGYFLRYGHDHHAFVLFPQKAFAKSQRAPKYAGLESVSHLAWQVATLREVTDAQAWLKERQIPIQRSGRDALGSNWQFAFPDPDHFANEFYYGMDQIGWDGASKPFGMVDFSGVKLPEKPIGGDFPEVVKHLKERGIDPRDGMHVRPEGAPRYNVGDVMLPRPFRITRHGPVRMFVEDVATAAAWYRDVIGLSLTEEIEYQGQRCAFLRVNTEHHSIALYPRALRATLPLRQDCNCMAYGMQLGSYRQLRDAIAFLEANGIAIQYLPPELFPGIDYSAFAIDPEGHAIHLYYYMEQIGWDGRPRPASRRRQIDNAHWPETLDALPDSYLGQVFQGPLG